MTETQGEFNLIIEKLESSDAPAAARGLAAAFGLDPDLTAAMVRKTLPVLFVPGLSKKEVRAITPKLLSLSELGFEFRISVRAPKIPRVNWLMRPQFTAAGTGSAQVAFDWQDQAFVCPGCGETFLFTRLGSIQPVQPTSAAPPPPPPPPSPVAEPAETTDEEESEFEPLPPPPPATEPGLEIPTFEEAESGSPLPADSESDAPILQEGGDAGPVPEPALQPVRGEGENYNVFVPEVKDPVKREEVVRLISSVRSCSPDEARKLTRRIMIPVAKNVSRTEAEAILTEFRKLKITGRMTRAARDGE